MNTIAINMFSLIECDDEASIIIDAAKVKKQEEKERMVKDREEKEREEKQNKLEEQRARERVQSEHANKPKRSIFNFTPYKVNRWYRGEQNQKNKGDGNSAAEGDKKKNRRGNNNWGRGSRGVAPHYIVKARKINGDGQNNRNAQDSSIPDKDDQKDHGEESNLSEKGQVSDVMQLSRSEKNDVVEEVEKVDGDNKENGAEGDNAVAASDEQKDLKASKKSKKKSKKKKSEPDAKPVKDENEKEDYRNRMTMAEYEKVQLEKRKAVHSLQTTETRTVTLDKDFESMQLLQKKTDDDLFIMVNSKKVALKKKDRLSKVEKPRQSVSFNESLKSSDSMISNGKGHEQENKRPFAGQDKPDGSHGHYGRSQETRGNASGYGYTPVGVRENYGTRRRTPDFPSRDHYRPDGHRGHQVQRRPTPDGSRPVGGRGHVQRSQTPNSAGRDGYRPDGVSGQSQQTSGGWG